MDLNRKKSVMIGGAFSSLWLAATCVAKYQATAPKNLYAAIQSLFSLAICLEVRGIMVVAALIDYGIVKRDPRIER